MLHQSIKRNLGLKKVPIDQLVYYLTFQRFSKSPIKKGRSTQDCLCLLIMIENCKKALDQGKEYVALLNDLSKAFDCLTHDLIVAKLHAYRFSLESLKLINSYLTDHKQRIKINDQFSSWMIIAFGVTQGSILILFLFNIFLGDIPFF